MAVLAVRAGSFCCWTSLEFMWLSLPYPDDWIVLESTLKDCHLFEAYARIAFWYLLFVIKWTWIFKKSMSNCQTKYLADVGHFNITGLRRFADVLIYVYNMCIYIYMYLFRMLDNGWHAFGRPFVCSPQEEFSFHSLHVHRRMSPEKREGDAETQNTSFLLNTYMLPKPFKGWFGVLVLHTLSLNCHIAGIKGMHLTHLTHLTFQGQENYSCSTAQRRQSSVWKDFRVPCSVGECFETLAMKRWHPSLQSRTTRYSVKDFSSKAEESINRLTEDRKEPGKPIWSEIWCEKEHVVPSFSYPESPISVASYLKAFSRNWRRCGMLCKLLWFQALTSLASSCRLKSASTDSMMQWCNASKWRNIKHIWIIWMFFWRAVIQSANRRSFWVMEMLCRSRCWSVWNASCNFWAHSFSLWRRSGGQGGIGSWSNIKSPRLDCIWVHMSHLIENKN